MAKKQKPSEKSENKSKTNKMYVFGAMAAVIIVAALLIVALSGKKEVEQVEQLTLNEEPTPITQEPIIEKYDLSTYTDNLNSYVGKEATLTGYLKWEQVENENDAIVNKYYIIDNYNNQIVLAFAGLNSDFSVYAPLFTMGETTTQAYIVEGTFRKTFNNIRFEVATITEK